MHMGIGGCICVYMGINGCIFEHTYICVQYSCINVYTNKKKIYKCDINQL